MADPSVIPISTIQDETAAETVLNPGPVSQWLISQALEHEPLGFDILGIEIIGVDPLLLPVIAKALKTNGFDYLQCQGGYDEGPGGNLVSFYHLIKLSTVADKYLSSTSIQSTKSLEEVRLKVLLPRDGALSVPSLYSLFRGADWQERETFDMFGISYDDHPHPKRLLMPEDWKGYPLRKDYVQPDFYEMQMAY
ncbi:MAG TPA: NAD(P)H-quinone oxidoreductase subunit J [Prochlorococcaceae cyanobacterium AMR_MDS_5431]|nr:NAD(P)H-quinone oxidoreductase subunit J [Prochlorococcaceae cyanobacterium AMR_MDS_5431]